MTGVQTCALPILSTIEVKSNLEEEIKAEQANDPGMKRIKAKIPQGKAKEFSLDNQGVLRYGNRLCVPDKAALKQQILREAHESAYSIHPGSTKMYQDLKQIFWWAGMKKEIAYHVACCNVCNLVKAEHQKPPKYLQPLRVPEWKWDDISMVFFVGLPKSSREMTLFG